MKLLVFNWRLTMKRRISMSAVLVVICLIATMAFAAARQWQTGKVLDTEQQKVHEGSTTTYHTEKDGSSRHTTATKSENVDTYEVYTIQGPERTYVAREKLNFPWSKPAQVTVGGDVQYAVDGRKLIILDENHKEHKASIVKTSINKAQ
jgi:hypothetical protein